MRELSSLEMQYISGGAIKDSIKKELQDVELILKEQAIQGKESEVGQAG